MTLTADAPAIDMSGFQLNAFGQPLNGESFWDFQNANDYTGQAVEQVYPDSNIPETNATSVGVENNSGPNISTYISPSANSLSGGVKNTLDYALKLSDSVLSSYAKLQQQQTNRYLGTVQADILRTNAQTSQEVARLNGQAKILGAQTLTNAARTGAGLASFGQNQGSFMLYLTILGVVFAGIQVMKSAK